MKVQSLTFPLLWLLVGLTWLAERASSQVATTRPQYMCLVYLEGFQFNLTATDKVRRYTGYTEEGHRFTTIAKLCTYFTFDDLVKEFAWSNSKDPDVQLDTNKVKPNVVTYCAGCAKDKKLVVLSSLNWRGSYPWEAAHFHSDTKNLPVNTPSKFHKEEQLSKLKFMTESISDWDVRKERQELEKSGFQITFENVCDFTRDTPDSWIYLQNLNYDYKTLLFKFVGDKACGSQIPDLIKFLSNNAVFLFLLFASSLVGLLLDQQHERVAMALASIQASCMLCTLIFMYNGEKGIIQVFNTNAQLQFGVITAVAAFVVFGFSFFSRKFSLVFVSIAFSYAIVWTILYIFTLIFGTFISIVIYVGAGIICCIAIVVFSYKSKRIQEKYSFIIYTSVANPFYLCLAISIWTNWYLDVMNFNRFEQFGKTDTVKFKNWTFLFVQLGLTGALIFLKLRKEMLNTLSAIKQNANLFSDKFHTQDSAYDPFADKGVNETIITM